MDGNSRPGGMLGALVVGAALVAGALLVRGALERQTAAIEGVQAALADVGKAFREGGGRPSAPSRADVAPGPNPGTRYAVKDEGAPVRGPADAKVTLVEFLDFQCPFCSRVQPTLAQIQQTYGDKVRIVFKHMPLRSIHPQAAGAAAAAEAAHGQGKFWEMHDLIFANQRELGDAKYQEWARQLGLDMDRFQKDLKSPALAQRIDADSQEAANLGVSGTPAFFINGRYLSGAQPFDQFKKLIDEELAKG
jgi:protein-disulfide isomerase